MKHLNIEIKARCDDHEKIRSILRENNADVKGADHQIDTYFKVPRGRLKLREGNIENFLVYYERDDQEGPKESKVLLVKNEPKSSLKEILMKTMEVLAVVDKRREISFIGNVKFHLDTVEGLGTFMEIEAIDERGTIGAAELQKQCRQYMDLFGIKEEDLLSVSYSDLILRKAEG